MTCAEEIAYRSGGIGAAQLEPLAQPMGNNGYGQYLLQVLKGCVLELLYARYGRCG